MSKHVVIVDLDRLQGYVFATHRLREIRGASALLSSIEAEVKKHVESSAEGSVIWLTPSGGTLRALVDSPIAPQIAKEASRMFLDGTRLATATSHAEPVKEEEPLGVAMDRAEKKLRRKKSAEPQWPWYPSHPLFRLCDLCGQYPAMHRSAYKPDGHDLWLLCDACQAKSDAAPRPDGDKLGPEAIAAAACSAAAERIGDCRAFDTPEDLGGLVTRRAKTKETGRDESAERRYMGVIYADGNRMGEKWKALCRMPLSARDYESLSTGIAEATRTGLIEAVAETARENWTAEEIKRQPGNGDGILPFIPLIVGGDDVVCVVPAAWALDVAEKLCAKFREKTKEAFTKVEMAAPAMSAGVVICKHKFPIQLAMELAKQLAREAKARCRELDKDPGAVDFLVVSESGTESLSHIRGSSYSRPSTQLTERPYLVCAPGGCKYLPLSALKSAAGVLLKEADPRKRVPRSKWKDLISIVRVEDEGMRTHAYAEWVEGLSKQQRDTWNEACQHLGLADPQGAKPPDQRKYDEGLFSTGLLDLVEILDILERGR